MKKLYVFPLQPLKERYTELWYKWFREDLGKYFDVEYVDGKPLTNRLDSGAFLPPTGAFYWELTQLTKFVEYLHNGKINSDSYVLLMDVEFPGTSFAVKHLANMLNLELRVYGWLHAGSYTRGDFTERFGSYQKWLELAWIKVFDGIFLASHYHKRALLQRRVSHYINLQEVISKLHVVGNPIKVRDLYSLAGIAEPKPFDQRYYDIIISDRPDLEKNIITAFAIAKMSNAKRVAVVTGRMEYRGWNFANAKKLATSLGFEVFEDLSKAEYYKILADSKVFITASPEENFGYCAVEAMAFETIPVMPNCCAFCEHVEGNKMFLYDTVDEAVAKVNKYLSHGVQVQLRSYVAKYEHVLDRVAKIILGGDGQC